MLFAYKAARRCTRDQWTGSCRLFQQNHVCTEVQTLAYGTAGSIKGLHSYAFFAYEPVNHCTLDQWIGSYRLFHQYHVRTELQTLGYGGSINELWIWWPLQLGTTRPSAKVAVKTCRLISLWMNDVTFADATMQSHRKYKKIISTQGAWIPGFRKRVDRLALGYKLHPKYRCNMV